MARPSGDGGSVQGGAEHAPKGRSPRGHLAATHPIDKAAETVMPVSGREKTQPDQRDAVEITSDEQRATSDLLSASVDAYPLHRAQVTREPIHQLLGLRQVIGEVSEAGREVRVVSRLDGGMGHGTVGEAERPCVSRNHR